MSFLRTHGSIVLRRCLGAFASSKQDCFDSYSDYRPSLALVPIGVERAGVWSRFDEVIPPVMTFRNFKNSEQDRLFTLNAWLRGNDDAGHVPWDTAPHVTTSDGGSWFLMERDGALIAQQFPDLPLINASSRWVVMRGANDSVLIFSR